MQTLHSNIIIPLIVKVILKVKCMNLYVVSIKVAFTNSLLLVYSYTID